MIVYDLLHVIIYMIIVVHKTNSLNNRLHAIVLFELIITFSNHLSLTTISTK